MKYEHLRAQDDFVFTEIFVWNVYQAKPEEIAGANILDIGGHYGMFDILCSDLGAKQIITVEANPNNFVTLLKNTKTINNIKAINAAVTNNTGDLITINNDGCKSQIGKGDISVSTVSFLDVIDMFPSNEDILLKMDIEGAEYSLFFNTPEYVFKRFKHIYIELHEESVAGPGNNIAKIDKFIKDLGFDGVWEGRFFTNKETGKEDNSEIGVFKYTRL